MADTAFLTDVKTLRERARQSLDDGASDMHDLLVAHEGKPFLPALIRP